MPRLATKHDPAVTDVATPMGVVNASGIGVVASIHVASLACIDQLAIRDPLDVNTDGSFDTSFDGPAGTGNGRFKINISGTDNGRDVAIQTDGQIVLAGTGGNNVFVGRFNSSDGSWDRSVQK